MIKRKLPHFCPFFSVCQDKALQCYKPAYERFRIFLYTVLRWQVLVFFSQPYKKYCLYPLLSRKHLGRRPRGVENSFCSHCPPEYCYSVTASKCEQPFRSQSPSTFCSYVPGNLDKPKLKRDSSLPFTKPVLPYL